MKRLETTSRRLFETHLRVRDAQVARVLSLGLDDFSTMLQDSTHVAGNSAWPTDSRLMVALVGWVLRVGAKLDRLHLPTIASPKAQRNLSVMTTLDREIDLMHGTQERPRARRRRYEKLCGAHAAYVGCCTTRSRRPRRPSRCSPCFRAARRRPQGRSVACARTSTRSRR